MGSRPRRLIAIDPGQTTGIAQFERGVLVFARAWEPRTVFAHLAIIKPHSDVVIELPRWYPQKRNIDVNDLIDLAKLAGEYGGPEALYVHPQRWKGSAPKKIHHKRVLAALTDSEHLILPKRPRAKDYDHNMLDAVGLGLWKLGRLPR